MRKEDKKIIIDNIAKNINIANHFYLVDIEGLNAVDTSDLRRICFKEKVKLLVVKNKLFKEALKLSEGNYDLLFPTLKGSTSVMFCDTGNAPAKLIKDFAKSHKKPVLKAAYVEQSIYIGAEELENLSNIKSKEELVCDIIGLLQYPAKNVISELQSGHFQIS